MEISQEMSKVNEIDQVELPREITLAGNGR